MKTTYNNTIKLLYKNKEKEERQKKKRDRKGRKKGRENKKENKKRKHHQVIIKNDEQTLENTHYLFIVYFWID